MQRNQPLWSDSFNQNDYFNFVDAEEVECGKTKAKEAHDIRFQPELDRIDFSVKQTDLERIVLAELPGLRLFSMVLQKRVPRRLSPNEIIREWRNQDRKTRLHWMNIAMMADAKR